METNILFQCTVVQLQLVPYSTTTPNTTVWLDDRSISISIACLPACPFSFHFVVLPYRRVEVFLIF